MKRIIAIDMEDEDFTTKEPYRKMKETVEEFIHNNEKDRVVISLTQEELNDYFSSHHTDHIFYIDYKIDKIMGDTSECLIECTLEIHNPDCFSKDFLDITIHDIADNKPPVLFAQECSIPSTDIRIIDDSGIIKKDYVVSTTKVFEVLVQLTSLNIAYLARS